MERRTTTTFGDYVAIARRRRGLLAIFCSTVMIIALALAVKLPAVYRASGTILLQASSIPSDLVRSTVGGYADQQIELIRRGVMTTARLAELVADIDPYPELPELSTAQKAGLVMENTQIERVDPITLEPLLESTAFSIHYHNPDPEKSAEMATAIVNMFLEVNSERRSESADETYQFLADQAALLEREIAEAEARLAEFKREYAGSLPENEGFNQAQLERAERDRLGIDSQIRVAEDQHAMIALQLAQTSPSLVAATANWRTELAIMQAELAVAQQRYTEDHPDVRRLRRSIQQLTAQSAGLDAAVQEPEPDNPVYLELSEQLGAAQRQLTALRTQRRALATEIEELTRRLFLTPEIEREYLSLTRDYEIAQQEYRDIKQKRTSADIARTLEREQRGERFTLIRAPYAPATPYSPNRIGIILLGVVLAFGGGIGLAALVETSDSTIRGSNDLQAVIDMPPIGAVPFIDNASDVRKRRLRWTAGIAVFAAALAGVFA